MRLPVEFSTGVTLVIRKNIISNLKLDCLSSLLDCLVLKNKYARFQSGMLSGKAESIARRDGASDTSLLRSYHVSLSLSHFLILKFINEFPLLRVSMDLQDKLHFVCSLLLIHISQREFILTCAVCSTPLITCTSASCSSCVTSADCLWLQWHMPARTCNIEGEGVYPLHVLVWWLLLNFACIWLDSVLFSPQFPYYPRKMKWNTWACISTEDWHGQEKTAQPTCETNELATRDNISTISAISRKQTPPIQSSTQIHMDTLNSAVGDSLQFQHRNVPALSIQDSPIHSERALVHKQPQDPWRSTNERSAELNKMVERQILQQIRKPR
jgi:hypothetical protein